MATVSSYLHSLTIVSVTTAATAGSAPQKSTRFFPAQIERRSRYTTPRLASEGSPNPEPHGESSPEDKISSLIALSAWSSAQLLYLFHRIAPVYQCLAGKCHILDMPVQDPVFPKGQSDLHSMSSMLHQLMPRSLLGPYPRKLMAQLRKACPAKSPTVHWSNLISSVVSACLSESTPQKWSGVKSWDQVDLYYPSLVGEWRSFGN
ncbi:hypothetical protein VPH35_072192 [Triticum aestivum]